MDLLTDVLKTITLSGSGFGHKELAAPWGIGMREVHLAMVHIVASGTCWGALEGREPERLQAGDVVLIPHGHAHRIMDAPGSPVLPIESLAGCPLPTARGGARGHMVCGFFNIHRRELHPLLAQLPPWVHVSGARGGAGLSQTLALIAQPSEGPGQEALQDQLAGLLLIQLIRAYLDTSPAPLSGWLGALQDERIGQALAAMHAQPEKPWSVEALAREVAMSRSAFAARFRALVGETPMSYLTRWRMHRAAHLLRTEAPTIAELSGRVGYLSEATFAKTFKRVLGLPPAAYRRHAATAFRAEAEAVAVALRSPVQAPGSAAV